MPRLLGSRGVAAGGAGEQEDGEQEPEEDEEVRAAEEALEEGDGGHGAGLLVGGSAGREGAGGLARENRVGVCSQPWERDNAGVSDLR